MTTILSAVAIIALLWTTLSALPAGLEARMPVSYTHLWILRDSTRGNSHYPSEIPPIPDRQYLLNRNRP